MARMPRAASEPEAPTRPILPRAWGAWQAQHPLAGSLSLSLFLVLSLLSLSHQWKGMNSAAFENTRLTPS